MIIKTKFNIGDKVYIVSVPLGLNSYQVFDAVKIIEIYIKLDKNNKIIIYRFKYNGKVNYYQYKASEENCFATREEAQEECNRRNNEADKLQS